MIGQERLVPGQVVERYVVEEKLGSGGMATVWRLRHRQLGTFHALKVLSNVGAHAEVRLMLEGRVQAALRHPNIVAVTDILDVAGSPGLLMEYVPPPSLSVWLTLNDPSIAEAEALFRGIVEGVRHAHDYGLVHRDLKPSNVLLARGEGGVLIPKVADFGLAKLVSEDPAAGHTRSGLVMGTPQYMAPEQIRDAKKVDRRADLYSLGCILYELLAGHPPFSWTDFITLFTEMQSRAYAPLPERVPARLREAVHGLLDPDRDTRIGDGATLVAVLDGRPRPLVTPPVAQSLPSLGDLPGLRVPAAAPSDETFSDTTIDLLTLAEPARPEVPPPPVIRPVPRPPKLPTGPTMVPPPASPAPRPASGRGSTLGLALGVTGGLGLLALVGLLAGIGWAAWSARSTPPARKPPAVAATAPKAEPPLVVPVEVAPAAPVGEPASVPEAAPSEPVSPPASPPDAAVEPPSAPEGTPGPGAVPEAPVEAPAATESPSHVTLDAGGDAARVELVGDNGRFPLPADVPPGSYDVYAWFPDSPQTKTSRVVLRAGDHVALRCLAWSMSCKAR